MRVVPLVDAIKNSLKNRKEMTPSMAKKLKKLRKHLSDNSYCSHITRDTAGTCSQLSHRAEVGNVITIKDVPYLKQTYADYGTGSKTDFSVWSVYKPFGSDNPSDRGCFILGFYARAGSYYQPKKGIEYCSDIDGVFAKPLKFTKGWDDRGTGGNRDGSLWIPVCPRNYVALGGVGLHMSNGSTLYPRNLPNFRCIHKKYTYDISSKETSLYWMDTGSDGSYDARVWTYGSQGGFFMPSELGSYAKPQLYRMNYDYVRN